MAPLRIALLSTAVYLVVGFLWIQFSDQALYQLTNDPVLIAKLQTLKGWGYVALTGLLLFGLVYSALRRERALNERDALTSLLNRFMFSRDLDADIQVAKKSKQTVTVLILNVDQFRQVNARAGQAAGDKLLQSISEQLINVFNTRAKISRLAGDEFAVAIVDVDWAHDLLPNINKLKQFFFAIQLPGMDDFRVTFSMGLAAYPNDAYNAKSLLNAALFALEEAKEAGADQLRVYNHDYEENILTRQRLYADLQKALQNNQLHLVYQPQFRSDGESVTGVEVLIRWQHPEHGLIGPDIFIPLAEQTGLIQQITDFVCQQSVKELDELKLLGRAVPRLSINVSAIDLEHEQADIQFDRRFKRLGNSWNCIQLEITETAAMQNTAAALKNMKALRSKGAQISLDDFGTGYSSLNLLRQLPIQEVKIDREFINDIPSAENDVKLVKMILAMANSLNIRIVAEGVESTVQARFLRQHGCDELQGYHFAKPMSAVELASFLD